MKHITITVTSELEDIELYLRDILTTMKHHDEVTDFSVKTSTFTERPVKEHSNNKSISNHEAAEILKLMPKQSDAIKKAIEVLERAKWHTEPPKKNGTYLIWWCNDVEIARYTDNLYEVDKYDFDDKKRPGWYKYDSEYGYYELECVKAWQELPSDYKESEDKE